MKPIFHKIVKICFILFLLYIFLAAAGFILFILTFEDIDRDMRESLGGRFEVGVTYGGKRGLYYLSDTLVFNLEKYFIKNPYIYIIGYYAASGNRISYFFLEDNELHYYEDEGIGSDEIPRFLILDYEKPELQTYVRLDEVPEEERSIFTLTLKECKKRGMRCWEKEEER